MRLMFLRHSIFIVLSLLLLSGCASNPEKLGLAYAGSVRTDRVELLVDETWVDPAGARDVHQEIFDAVLSMIDQAEQYILIDMFLLNNFGYQPGPCMRPLSRELTDRLISKRAAHPEVEIVFISDPINHLYGSVKAPHFEALEAAGVQVVWTDLNPLRDSNPVYSLFWRVLVRPFGVGPGKTLSNPLGEGRISLRSQLKLLNFKANHRKVIITDKGLLVTSANPHSASSAHWNTALRVDRSGMNLGIDAEKAILQFSDAKAVADGLPLMEGGSTVRDADGVVELLTEIRIREKVIELLDQASAGSRIDLCMFYMSEREVVKAFIRAQERGCRIRVILDPSKDAFGRTKNGIPNRQTAARLVRAGIPLRWADTHGEQCHVKLLYVEHDDGRATLLQGSANYTRRNLNNFNCETDVAFSAPPAHPALARARTVFDRWWSNTEEQRFTVEYAVYADSSRWRRFRAWWQETTGMSTF